MEKENVGLNMGMDSSPSDQKPPDVTKEEKCPMPVPFCLNLKKKIKRLQRQVRRQAEMERELTPPGGSQAPDSITDDQMTGPFSLGVGVGMKLRSQTPAASMQRTDGRSLVFVVRSSANKAQEVTQAFPAPDPTKTPFQQLQEALKLPDTPEQRHHILLIIKNNPSLLKQYISYRQLLSQQSQ